MFERIETLRMARAMTDHAVARQNVVARNVANADTPGFKARDLEPFADSYRRPMGAPKMAATRAGHLADPFWNSAHPRELIERDGASPDGNTVSLEDEIARAADVKHGHEIALAVYRSGLGMLRTSLGRRG